MHVELSLSSGYTDRYKGVPFGVSLVSGCSNQQNPPGFDLYKRKLLRKMRRRENLERISRNIELYERFFEGFGYSCPLPKHLKRTVNSGFPRYNLMVDAHFMAEMCGGVLVAVGDFDRFEGRLTLDIADDSEVCIGMGGREMRTKEGEIVLRDEKEIVCILCQGPDEKTRVREDTKNVLFYAYGIPGIDPDDLTFGLRVAADTMVEFGGGTMECLNSY